MSTPQPASRKKMKGNSYTDDDCAQLSKSWNFVSEDPILGSGQKAEAFWSRIHRHFSQNSPPGCGVRSQKSLQNKNGDIFRDLLKFIGYLAAVERLNESGTTFDDRLKKAHQLYKYNHEKKEDFPYIQSFYILRDKPKFLSQFQGEPGFSPMQSHIDLTQDDTLKPLGVKCAKRERKLEQYLVKQASTNLKAIGEAKMIQAIAMRMQAEAIQMHTWMQVISFPTDSLALEDSELISLMKKRVKRQLENDLDLGRPSTTSFAEQGSGGGHEEPCTGSHDAMIALDSDVGVQHDDDDDFMS